MRRSACLAALLLSLLIDSADGGQGQPPAPVLLFNLTLQNQVRQALSQNSITTPNLDLQLYGDGANIIVATGPGPNLPRTFFGLCKGPCGFTLRDRNTAFDLRGRAHITFTTIVSGFHRVRPLIKPSLTARSSSAIRQRAPSRTITSTRFHSVRSGGFGWIPCAASRWAHGWRIPI